MIATGGSIPLLCLEGVPDLPGAHQDEASLTKKFETTWNNRLLPNRERSTSRLHIVTLLIYVRGIFQVRLLEWVAISFSGGSSQPREDLLGLLYWQAGSLLSEPAGKPKNTGVGSLSLLQGIFLTQESNQGKLNKQGDNMQP